MRERITGSRRILISPGNCQYLRFQTPSARRSRDFASLASIYQFPGARRRTSSIDIAPYAPGPRSTMAGWPARSDQSTALLRRLDGALDGVDDVDLRLDAGREKLLSRNLSVHR